MNKKLVLLLNVLFSFVLKASLAQCSNEDKPAPYPTDCTKFYLCPGNFEMSCGPGTHFNSKILACDWPNRAGCKSGGPAKYQSPPGKPSGLPGIPPDPPLSPPEKPPVLPPGPPDKPTIPHGKPTGLSGKPPGTAFTPPGSPPGSSRKPPIPPPTSSKKIKLIKIKEV
ncbi:uncharacterized protein LOC126883914 [Diabrotica virgifera virgifera]|uniref:Chitin-binding type-2 domain-containing protein n=1 Tax=Diabrotica virgifera virgifera TaxID=50390 RepID=A0ABM5K5X3_DIAVI|nr:uncharacterized protein LOC126883914 [Diabrotica virgifera virgifera]